MIDLAQTSGVSPGNKSSSDFLCENHGTIFLLIPRTTPAKTWVGENLPEDRMTLVGDVVVEWRYIADIVRRAMTDGLVVA